MHKRPGIETDTRRGAAPLVVLAGWAALLGAVALPQAARAQFFFWDRPRFSADDAARSAMDRGFRPLARPVRNDNVYVADVVDRRGRHERLIISADNGEIVQRFYVDFGSGPRRYADPTIPRGPTPPGRIPDEDNQPNVFSRLFSGDHDGSATGATPLVPDQSLGTPDDVRPPRVKRRPKVVERTPDSVRPSTQIESAPLAPVSPNPAAPAAATPPAIASAPDRPIEPPANRPVRSITTNPLSLPGTREQDEKMAPRATAAVVPATPATSQPKPAPAPAKPASKPPTAPDVPVAPLD